MSGSRIVFTLLAFVVLLAPVGCDSGDGDPLPDAGDRGDAASGASDAGGSDAGASDAGASDAGASDAGASDAGGSAADTAGDLAAFWSANGGRESFPESYVDAVEALLYAEDEVAAGDFAAARSRIDAVFAAYPLSDPVWWSGVGQSGTNVGTPVAYYGLRMLDEIASAGVAGPLETSVPITMSIVMPRCATGTRPTNVELTEGESVDLTLDPALAADDYFIIRQSLRLFQHYVWAITGGALRLELRFVPVDACVTVSYRSDPAYSGIDNANQAIDEVPREIQNETDMWWVLYPSNVPSDPIFDETAFITGGMGGRGRAPLFIIDDLWLVRKPPHLGRGPYTAVERRVYLPQWLQHEFFHHLFRTWPEFGLEETGHQWFDRSTWPDDFVGVWEPDYYAEALRRRLYDASPTMTEAFQTAIGTFDPAILDAADFAGSYERRPVENDWHRVTIVEEAGGLVWRNAAAVQWSLRWESGELWTGEDCPYGPQPLVVEVERDDGGEPIPVVKNLYFGGEAYNRL